MERWVWHRAWGMRRELALISDSPKWARALWAFVSHCRGECPLPTPWQSRALRGWWWQGDVPSTRGHPVMEGGQGFVSDSITLHGCLGE